MQHHEILRFEDPHRIFDPEGANAALVEAKKAGKLRYIGFTAIRTRGFISTHLEVAREHGFHFDTVQMPLNVMDAHYRSFAKLVVPELVKEGIGVLGMKPLANGRILQSGHRIGDRVPALRTQSADIRGDHRTRLDAHPGPGFQGYRYFQAA